MESHRIHLAVFALWHYCGVVFLWLGSGRIPGILWRFKPGGELYYPTCRF
jgi:hypothetical protein